MSDALKASDIPVLHPARFLWRWQLRFNFRHRLLNPAVLPGKAASQHPSQS